MNPPSARADAQDPVTACAAYGRVARAIAAIRAAGTARVDLPTLARSLGTTPATLERTFRAWAGVSPKRFAQALATVRAAAALRRGRSVLDAALDAGLSGPGRLHDLLVTVEGCTPGAVRTRGAGLAFDWGTGPTPLGTAFLAVTGRGVHRLSFVEGSGDVARERAALGAAWPRAALRESPDVVSDLLGRIFVPPAVPRPLHLWVRGTNFQLAVWRALLRLPAGAVARYADVARWVRAPRAVRAVAGAVARNPVAWIVPCHRVLRADGDLAGYAWGVDRKAALLGREALGADAREPA